MPGRFGFLFRKSSRRYDAVPQPNQEGDALGRLYRWFLGGSLSRPRTESASEHNALLHSKGDPSQNLPSAQPDASDVTPQDNSTTAAIATEPHIRGRMESVQIAVIAVNGTRPTGYIGIAIPPTAGINPRTAPAGI
ncbi:hypothetical protein DOTSEDRAFT_74656 [Dothistroma septosporum NZE10]|uniref:Uncharacterized protein n=1 Tax=Dothistroma septosporum (strain NZE10 / CBS 128990) TaxID=675120 RepID=N1PE20_DOTSN|nr:hypothetical protein DOTSEDRAFT_74656 [Dothistroma septosporum NZE10]